MPLEKRPVVAREAQPLVDILDEDVDLVQRQARQAAVDLVLSHGRQDHQHALQALVLPRDKTKQNEQHSGRPHPQQGVVREEGWGWGEGG